MNQPIIEVKNISKKYDIALMRGGYVALRDVLAGIFKNPVRFVADKAKSAAGMKKKQEFWALRNVSFEVARGEVIGVIGANGAGKSTLLKVLSQITPPTEGEVILRGRVGSLLEVGTGFHPELTGRENIFLNGAILGMKRTEIAQKFDAIVAFAGIDKFLDTPVKHYSSGMYVRLAFSVAAHMEPDILVVDEVLAVGDAEFQKKCLGKMDEITKKDGRTILFVSHNMGAIQNLCKRCVLLKHGRVDAIGPTDEIIELYMKDASRVRPGATGVRTDRQGSGDLRITDAYLLDSDGNRVTSAVCGKPALIALEYRARAGVEIRDLTIGLNVLSTRGESVFLCHTDMTQANLGVVSGEGRFECKIKELSLVAGSYSIDARIVTKATVLDYIHDVASFEVLDGDFFGTGSSIRHSLVYVKHAWKNRPL